ncbi:vigilin [Nephila pilipes]|uniref:Vigilin n=1 Tax=Nephila pilipes TaxID=299642 RepID=A0A8X6U7T5_NEPPI|nr:vigilin [Nephila pilipes]
MDSLRQTEFTFGKNGIHLCKKFDDVLKNIANDDSNYVVDISHIVNCEIHEEEQNLVTNYKSHKIKDTKLKITILLNDEIPAAQRSRKLLFLEQKVVKKLIREWLNDGIDKAHHEIQLISDEQIKLAFVRLLIFKMHFPFIFGPFKETIAQIIRETKARINIPPTSVMKDDLTIAGEKEAVAKAKARIQNIYEERKRNCRNVSVEVPENQHKYFIRPWRQTIQEILQEIKGTDCDKVLIHGLKDDVMKARKRLLEISNGKQLVGYTTEIEANPERHKFLMSKNRDSIKKEEVEVAKNELNSLIPELKDTPETTTKIDPKHHCYFVSKRTEVLEQIS